ncbi:MAG TPA: glycosyltransferase family 4 protein [Methyloceanibacter sp.]|nr:glycosyltransferase family 4 protein [Methyloceanibacter sp.]
MTAPRLLYVVTEDWYFLSHRLPMARAAKAAGYDVHVATRINRGKEAIEAEGFTPHSLSWQRGSLSPTHSLAGVAELRKLLHALKPDILHNISLKPVLLGGIASLGLSSIAVVNSLTGLGTLFVGNHRKSELTRPLVVAALKALLKRPNVRTIVQNPDDKRFVLGLGVPEGSVDLIPGSGVDLEHFTPLPEPPPPVTAAYVGRMLADKGVLTLIEAHSLATSRGVKLQLLLAGDTDRENPGSLAPEQLREFASAFGIRWLGHVADIREVWERAHVAVLASRREGLPKSLLEAAACGRPMIATDTPGCREIAISGKTALTFPVDDAAALAEALTQMAGDADMRARFGSAARALVEEKFSAEAIGKATVALYQSLVPSRR